MTNTKIISPGELSEYGSIENLNAQVVALLAQQKVTWETAAKNFEAISRIQTKQFDFGHFRIATQFNPERIRSSAAKTDAKSLAKRPCFLCIENLPNEQKGILYRGKYIILINPYPIFKRHIVISGLEHVPQQIQPYFSDLLDLSECLPDFTVFYNGPRCGASAPDHFHFQAVGKGNLQVEKEFELLENNYSEILIQNENLKIIAVENYLRKFVAIISNNKKIIKEKFEQIYGLLDLKNGEEPMVNVLCNFTENQWRIIIFPREKQRPSHFFKENGEQIVVGPASVEMGGVLVLPREEDFIKITSIEIAEIYDEVTINNERFASLINQIKSQNEV